MNYNNTNHKLGYLKVWFEVKEYLIKQYFENLEERKTPQVLTGEIYFAHLGTNIGEEIDKTRPVMILQKNSHFLRNRNTVFVIPITSKTKLGTYRVDFSPSDLIIGDTEMVGGVILIYQARTISKTRLRKRIGKLSDQKIEEVKEVLGKFLEI